MFKLWDLIKPREPLLGFTVQIIVKHSPLTWKLDHFEFRYPPLGELDTIIHQLYKDKTSCETCINTVLTLHQLCTLDMARLKSHIRHISVNTASSVHSSKHWLCIKIALKVHHVYLILKHWSTKWPNGSKHKVKLVEFFRAVGWSVLWCQ